MVDKYIERLQKVKFKTDGKFRGGNGREKHDFSKIKKRGKIGFLGEFG